VRHEEVMTFNCFVPFDTIPECDGRIDGQQTDGHLCYDYTGACIACYATVATALITRGRVRAGPSFQLGTLPTPIDRRLVFSTRWFSAAAAAAAAENQRVGKTRRRSIYSADRHTTDTTYHQPTSQPK